MRLHRRVIGIGLLGCACFLVAATAVATNGYEINFAPPIGDVGSVTFSPSGGTGCSEGTVVGISPSNVYKSEGTIPTFPDGTLTQSSFTFTTSNKNGSGGTLTVGTLGAVGLAISATSGTGTFNTSNVLEWTPELVVSVSNGSWTCVAGNKIAPTFTSTTSLVDGDYNGTLSVGTASSAAPNFAVQGTCLTAIAEELNCHIGVLSGISTGVSYSEL